MKKLAIIVIVLLGVIILFGAVFSLMDTTKSFVAGDKVAVVRIEGPIIDSKHFVDEIKEYADDSSVKAIVLRVDSPGGAVAPSQEIYAEVKRAVSNKEVVASMGAVAASGGYYVAAPSTKIVANPGTITGSIGVIMEIPNFEGLMDKVGIKTTVVKSGRYKDMASAMRELTPEERRLLQSVMDDVHEQFIQAVAEGREMTFEDVAKLSDGRIFSGRQAKELGLVDELGSLEDAIDLTAELVGIKGEPEIVEKKRKLTFMELLQGEISGKIPDMSRSIQIKYLLSP
jgi:protease-4